MIGTWFQAPSGVLDMVSGDGGFEISFEGSAPATLVVAVQDYAACAEDVAIDEMVARAPTLGAQFGTVIEGVLNCLSVGAATAMTVGTATSQTLVLAPDPAVDAFLQSGDAPLVLDSGVDTYFGDPALVGSAVAGLPAGLTATVDPVTLQVSIQGTPTQSGVFEASVIVYRTDIEEYASNDVGNGIPLVAPLTLTVAGPALPATGSAPLAAPVGLALGFLALGALALGGAAATRSRV